MTSKPRYLILFFYLLATSRIFAQESTRADSIQIPSDYKPEFRRQINHDAIDKAQMAILSSDGTADSAFNATGDEEINYRVTKALVSKIDAVQYLLETDPGLDHRLKVNYLFGLENLLKYFRANWRIKSDKKINAAEFPALLHAFIKSVELDRYGETVFPAAHNLSYAAGNALMGAGIFSKNPGYAALRNEIILKYCVLHPEKTFFILNENPDVPFADSLVKVVAKNYPKLLYDYSQAGNKFGVLIRSIRDDAFVQTVTRMSRSRDGQQYFCFLDNIYQGKLSFEEIDAAKNDSLLYYRLLVRTRMDYTRRLPDRDTAFEYKTLEKRLEIKAKENFVNTINALHNENAEVRFNCLQPLSAEELYYLAVSSDGSIYTSSFVKGVYPLMMKKINNRGDSLLLSLYFDRYRKFIKMAAGYNTLSHFLSTFPQAAAPGQESDAEVLMRAFVGKLEAGNGLEDGVDVADSYASIAESIKPLAGQMLKNVQSNLLRNEASGNKRGIAMYKILNSLFLSADSTSNIDLTKELGIPPVYDVPYAILAGDSSKVIIQVFFYGDKDGQGIFRGFLGMFSNTNWKTDGSNSQWVQITSVKGKPVQIFANRPLPEETGEDEKAQKALREYLERNKLYPSITIHRGHSYYANSTIAQMFASSRIVFLGSCGGYHLIHDVLATAPDAHIIASKQIGATEVNRPFFQLLTDKIRNGNGIEWIPFWKELDQMVSAKEFEDYIPPYKNLGALFIKAYKIAMSDAEDL